jgi:CubicO group peptidase (beta-lactamase class C family)
VRQGNRYSPLVAAASTRQRLRASASVASTRVTRWTVTWTLAWTLAWAMVGSACAVDDRPSTAAAEGTVSITTTIRPADMATSTTTSTTASTTSSSSTTTTTSSSTTTTTTTITTTITPTTVLTPGTGFVASNAVFETLARRNPAASMTVHRDGVPVFSRAAGTTIDGGAATSDSGLVVASVSKLITAQLIARLDQQGAIDVGGNVPWGVLGLMPHPGWLGVTVRELLDHTSGMPVVRSAWFAGGSDCAAFLPTLLTEGPRIHRGRWTYSNGNYCALGLLVEAVTGEPLDTAAQRLLLAPLAASGVAITTAGLGPRDIAHAPGVERLSRLGGAGGFVISTDDVAALLAATTDQDRHVMRWPAVFVDQYGWGHTGTVDGARACAWTLESGRTVVVAAVAGDSPATGGAVCDVVVPAVAADVGFRPPGGPPDGTPVRSPP